MQPRLPHIASLTADYDAIERAIRETSRGRWFLATYLERNRSAETRILLDAIGKLERSMHENGHIVANAMAPMETLVELRDTIAGARDDIARTRKRDGSPSWLPVPRFTFDSLATEVSSETRAIRASAANLQTAATALRSAGLFQGVAQQIGDRVEDIVSACEAQDAAMKGMDRMAALLSELEAEIMAALDGDGKDTGEPVECNGGEYDLPSNVPQLRAVPSPVAPSGFTIPPEVMRELSEALSGCLHDDDDEAFPDLP